jgi:flagellar hook-basal body complex protein FliE
MSDIPAIGPVGGLQELPQATGSSGKTSGPSFGQALREAIESVDHLQKESESAQASFARGEEIDLHDVLIRIEEAEVAFKTMMEVRNKLVDAYREVMRMGV